MEAELEFSKPLLGYILLMDHQVMQNSEKTALAPVLRLHLLHLSCEGDAKQPWSSEGQNEPVGKKRSDL